MKNDRVWELLARKMSGEANTSELEELNEILRSDPQLYFSFQAFSKLWQHSTSDAAYPAALEAYAKHHQKMKQSGIAGSLQNIKKENEIVLLEGSRQTPFRRYLIGSVAALLILFAGGWFFLSSGPHLTNPGTIVPSKEPKSTITTEYGSKTTRIQLPDGSQVWLNAGSKLDYTNDFGKNLREVQLIGEGFFDVVKNPKIPFVIHTSSIDIKVLGTQLNVKSYPGDKTSETSLVRGSVEVIVRKRPDQRYILKPNEKIVVLNEDPNEMKKITESIKSKAKNDPIIEPLTYKAGDSVAVEASWTHNKLSFEEEPFAEVAKKMERWYDVRFEFRNSNLEEIRINGSFTIETLPQAMEALKYIYRFRYEIADKTIIVY